MSHDKKMLDREAVRSVIQQWNANRLDLFALSEPDENLLFHGVMRFYFQDAGQKVATKCIRVASDATVTDVIDTLIEKFRPDMRMLSVPNYALYEVHANGEERRLNPDEKPLLVQLNWHIDDREGRFLLKNIDQKTTPIEQSDLNFKRKLSKREKKEQKKKEKMAKLSSDVPLSNGSQLGLSSNGIGGSGSSSAHMNGNAGGAGGGSGADAGGGGDAVAGKLYTELPETSFTRSISNPEAVMRRRRQQKLEKKLQQFRSRDGGPDTGGTLKIYGESLCQDVPYKTLLLSIRDCAQAVVREMLTKYGLEKADPLHYCLVQVNSDGTEYILDDDECPLSILMNHPTSRGSIMFHVRRRPADSQPRRRKKKPLGAANGANHMSGDREGPVLVEVTHSGDGGRRIKLGSDPVEVGSANTNCLQLFGPSIQPRHCLISLLEGVCTVTPLHTDALTFVNGHHISQPTILHNGSVVMFGRVASYRFLDSPTDGRYNLALSQSQLDSACLYESRSPTSPGSWNDEDGALSSTHKSEYEQHQQLNQSSAGFLSNNNNNNTATLRDVVDSKHGGPEHQQQQQQQQEQQQQQQQVMAGATSNYDGQSLEGNLENEIKSISSMKSGGSNSQERSPKLPGSGGLLSGAGGSGSGDNQGQEPILPAVLEFPETHQELFLRHIISELDVNVPHFKLAPVYSLYLCARYRASTHYRPELQPTERAHKLTIFLHHVANLVYGVVQEQYTDPRILAFWMANSSEFLHFLKSDRHISAFSVQAQEVLAEAVQTAFRNLVNCFRLELSQTLNQFLSETIDHDSAAGLVLTVLGSAMALLRRCRVNAALTIQLFSQLFHYINVICFNTIVANSHMCTSDWGKVMTERLQLLELWAERQGLELAADCHLAKINQCAQFLQAPKSSVEEIQQLACSCFRLNSLQMSALLQQEKIPRNLVDTAIRMAESVADELTRADGREVRLEESPELHLALLLPDDGFSCDVVRGIPTGLVDFLNPLQQQGMCRLAAQPTSIGLWTVYMHQFNARSSSSMSNKLPQPEVQLIKLHKNSNGMGLSIVAAKGAGQERLGIYIKSVVPGGAADADGRLQAGDQLLRVDGQSLIGITQERAADYLVRTGPVVSLEVAKQGAIYHGLATLLQQPSPVIQRGNRRMSERDLSRMGGAESSKSLIANSHTSHSLNQHLNLSNSNINSSHTLSHIHTNNSNSNNNSSIIMNPLAAHLPNSKSVPALHHHTGSGNISLANSKSRSTHSLHNNAGGAGGGGGPGGGGAGIGGQLANNSLNNPNANSNGNVNGNEQGFYQNLSVYRAQNQSQPMLNERPSMSAHAAMNAYNGNSPHAVSLQQQQHQQQQQQQQGSPYQQHLPSRPVSAYYHSQQSAQQQLQQQQQQQQQQQHALQHQQFAHSSSNLNGQQHQQQQQQLTLNNRAKSQQNFQHTLRMQQMMAPSMPNISNMYQQQQQQQQHPQQQQQQQAPQQQPLMSSSQSMQNVNEFVPGAYQNGGLDYQQHARRSQLHEAAAIYELQQQQQQQQQASPNFITLPPKPMGSLQSPSKPAAPPSTAPKPQQQQQQQQLQQQQLQQQQLQQRLQQQQQQAGYLPSHVMGEDKPPLPPTATHPLFKATQQLAPGMNYVASTLDPPKGSYLPANQSTASARPLHSGSNPWEREEREKDLEMRREHIRQWREQQIGELSSTMQRTPQQEEQLKTLILERDFERRAQELQEQEDDQEQPYDKDNVQELFRLSASGMPVGVSAIQTPITSYRQTDIKLAEISESSPVESVVVAPPPAPATAAATSSTAAAGTTQQQQPKSILKHNRYSESGAAGSSAGAPSSPSKSQKSASFADERHLQTEHPISSLAKELTQLSMLDKDNNNETMALVDGGGVGAGGAVPPPPPPERNSSYLIMSQQKIRSSVGGSGSGSSMGLLKTATSNQAAAAAAAAAVEIKKATSQNNNNNLSGSLNNNTMQASPLSAMELNAAYVSATGSGMGGLGGMGMGGLGTPPPLLQRDNKRVSFHDEENNLQQQYLLDNYTLEHQDLDTIREDASYLQHNLDASMLPSMPATPDTALWNTSVQSTPGVIGAQEVYRDPRQRRLAEKQQQQQQQRAGDAVPEKLSFKEKMKMFALESGEDNTPKDKLKISRAQRDIDAVH